MKEIKLHVSMVDLSKAVESASQNFKDVLMKEGIRISKIAIDRHREIAENIKKKLKPKL